MFKQIFSALVGTAVVGVSFAGNANASGFGQFQLGGGVLLPGGVSTVDLNSPLSAAPELDFSPEPTPISIVSSSGIFTGFDTASIEDIISFGPPVTVDNPFIDFGVSDFGAGGVSTPGNASLSDGVDTFELNEASYTLAQSGANVAIDVSLWGDFIIGGATYQGAGNLTFQTNNTSVAAVESLLASGGSLEGMTFSGALFTADASVPEPSSVLSLLAIGGAAVGSKLKKKAAA
ncbi:MAG: PEP-CTERM sorting domain-containing protein [Cyanobacteria bacterium P01_A01_bin.105]